MGQQSLPPVHRFRRRLLVLMNIFTSRIARTVALLVFLLLVLGALRPTELLAQLDVSEEIIWIDGDGYIRVLDTTQVGENPAVEWISPVGDWRHFAAGDFNADGDFEIVAIGGDLEDGKLAVYDPVVVNDDDDSLPRINGIPWTELYAADLIGSPTLVAAGDFDPARPGDEILYGEKIDEAVIEDPGQKYQVTVLRAANPVPDGRSWEPMFDARRYRHTWTWVFAGDLDLNGADEIVLADDDDGILSIYQIKTGLDDDGQRILNLESDTWPWRAAAIGQFRAGDNPEVVAIRYAPLNLPSFYTFQYNDGNFWDDYSEVFDPSPRFVFLGDITGSGDDEVFLLRDVPSTVTDRARLIMRNKGTDNPNTFEDVLDADSGYRAGAAGDIDGDGKDEVVVIRDNRLRIYTDPATSTNHTLKTITTNRRSVTIADLDKNGFYPVPRFGASLTSVDLVLAQGESSQLFRIELSNMGTSTPIPFSAVLDRSPAWAKLTQSAADTPADLTVSFQTIDLFPGTYVSEIVVRSTDPDVAAETLIIPIKLTVEASLTTVPQQAIFDFFPCSEPLQPLTLEILVEGPTGLSFAAEVVADLSTAAAVDWLTVTPASGVVPAAVQLTADPAKWDGRPYQRVYLRVRDGSAFGGAVVTVPVDVLCMGERQSLPLIMR